MVNENKKGTQI